MPLVAKGGRPSTRETAEMRLLQGRGRMLLKGTPPSGPHFSPPEFKSPRTRAVTTVKDLLGSLMSSCTSQGRAPIRSLAG